ncbi:MAG: hypothetical protein JWM99_2883 [Verrucomicrobiales bacterium]|nr:hypothetical protein [Verrucomicrobiales bacterium]
MEVSLPATSSANIARLTERLARGEEAAFEEFHELYFDRLHQFLLIVARGQMEEVQEALQETLLRVARYARSFETEEAFWGWLKVVARNAARDRGRKEQRYLAVLKRFAFGLNGGTAQDFGDDEERLRLIVEESLAELDPRDRCLIQGKYLEDETVNELSGKTGLTERAVESRLLRLRRELRERMLKKLRSL